jgi:hypothetical protein
MTRKHFKINSSPAKYGKAQYLQASLSFMDGPKNSQTH